MKVLLLCGVYTDGKTNIASQFVHHQALALKKKGVEVCVLSMDTRSLRRKRKFGIYRCTLDEIPVFVASFPCGPLGAILRLVSRTLAKKTFRLILKDWGMPDIIHGHFYYNAYAAIPLSQKYNVPLVTTEHTSNVLTFEITEQIKKQAKSVYEKSDSVICVSEGLYASIIDFFSGNVTVINNIASAHFHFMKKEKREPFTFLSVGELIYMKRFDLTIAAFAQFAGSVPDSKLIIVGMGEEKNALQVMVDNLKISDKVEFKGRVENKLLPAIFGESHCFVLPSDYETFGVVYIEAIACGLPVISAKHAQQNKIINEKNGIAIEENTVENVYKAMVNIYENYQSYDRECISRDALYKYGEEKIAGELVEIYEGLLKA